MLKNKQPTVTFSRPHLLRVPVIVGACLYPAVQLARSLFPNFASKVWTELAIQSLRTKSGTNPELWSSHPQLRTAESIDKIFSIGFALALIAAALLLASDLLRSKRRIEKAFGFALPLIPIVWLAESWLFSLVKYPDLLRKAALFLSITWSPAMNLLAMGIACYVLHRAGNRRDAAHYFLVGAIIGLANIGTDPTSLWIWGAFSPFSESFRTMSRLNTALYMLWLPFTYMLVASLILARVDGNADESPGKPPPSKQDHVNAEPSSNG